MGEKLEWTHYYGNTKYAGNWQKHFEILNMYGEGYLLTAYSFSQFDDQPHHYFEKKYETELQAETKANAIARVLEVL